MAKSKGDVEIKLVMISLAKNYDFWRVDKSVC